MDDNVVPLRPRDEGRFLWVCLCGCTTFRLFSDGHAECASCEVVAKGEPDGWREKLPTVPVEAQQVEPDAFAVKNLDDADVFLKRHARDASDVAAAILLYANATISTWQRHDAKRNWIADQLDHAKTRLIGDSV